MYIYIYTKDFPKDTSQNLCIYYIYILFAYHIILLIYILDYYICISL